MLKHTVKLECKVGDYEGIFICDHDSPLPVAKEMIIQFLKHLGNIEDNIKEQSAQIPKTELPIQQESTNEKTESQVEVA